MTRRQLPPELLQEIRDRAAGWGKIVARRAFGDDGPGLNTDFETMEQLAHAAAAGLSEGALDTLLEQQAQTLGEQVRCPACPAATLPPRKRLSSRRVAPTGHAAPMARAAAVALPRSEPPRRRAAPMGRAALMVPAVPVLPRPQ